MLDGVGLIHMNGRVYDPTVGRFLSVDPIVRDIAASQSWNGYGYVEGRVLSATDPSGYCPGNLPGNACGILLEGDPSLTVMVEASRLFRSWETTLRLQFDTVRDSLARNLDSAFKEPSQPASEDVGEPPPKEKKCWNFSLGVGASGAVVTMGGGGGLSPLGISYGGSLLDTRLFVQSQAYGLFGLGAFFGVGISAQVGPGAIAGGTSTARGVHGEADVGTPPLPVSFSVTGDWFPQSGGNAGGFHGRLPGGRLGSGFGVFAGIGPASQASYGLPTVRELVNYTASSLGLSGLQTSPEACDP